MAAISNLAIWSLQTFMDSSNYFHDLKSCQKKKKKNRKSVNWNMS